MHCIDLLAMFKTYVSLSLNRFPFVFLQAKEPAGDDKTVPDSIKSNLEEFTKEQIQVCSEGQVSFTMGRSENW